MKAFLLSKAIVALIIFLAIEVAVFRTGLYDTIVKPVSFAGMLMQRCQLAKAKRTPETIALLGDSRLREGFSARAFDRIAAKTSLKALNLSLSGSDPRVWYYFLKNIDPNCASFKMIVIALPSYWDEDYANGASDRRDDLHLLLPILGLGDAFEFIQSFQDHSMQMEATITMCLKMYGFRQDWKDFIANPGLRFKECELINAHWQEAEYIYEGSEKSLGGAHMVNSHVIGLPSFITPYQKMRLELTLLGLSERSVNYQYPYLQFWLDKLSNRYATSPTKLVFIRIPARPFNVPLKHQVHRNAIDTASKFSNVIVEPDNSFSFLEKPEYFFDDVHLNREGRKILTKNLSLRLIKIAQDRNPKLAAQ